MKPHQETYDERRCREWYDPDQLRERGPGHETWGEKQERYRRNFEREYFDER